MLARIALEGGAAPDTRSPISRGEAVQGMSHVTTATDELSKQRDSLCGFPKEARTRIALWRIAPALHCGLGVEWYHR
jgi:ribosomal protein L37E